MDFLKNANLLCMTEWKQDRFEPRQTTCIADSLKAIHDVLEVAAQADGAKVSILCSTLSMLLREGAWREHTGATFAEQLHRALARKASAHILVFGDAESIYPVAPSILALLSRFGVGSKPQLRIEMTGKDQRTNKFFRDFPHFTMTTVGSANNAHTFVHMEWEHPGDTVDWLNGKAPFSGQVFAAKDDANEPLGLLRRRFENLFKAYAKHADVAAS